MALFLFLFYSGLINGQDLRNTEWVKISAERKDGSKIIERSGKDNAIIKYFFKEDTVLTSINDNEFSAKQKYSVHNGILSIGDLIKYNIDTINDIVLVITEIPKYELPYDRISRYTFIKSKFLFEYLKQAKQLNIIGDTLIQCDNQFSPTYVKGDIGKLFLGQFQPTTNRVLTGYFIISDNGNIKSVKIDPKNNFSKKEIEKFIRILNSTSGSWILPATTKPLQFKIDFGCEFTYYKPLSFISFSFHKKDHTQYAPPVLTQKEKAQADTYFNKGMKLFDSEKFEKASIEFAKCLEIDSLFLDAYYNKAWSDAKLGNTKLACESWLKLKEMGQKQGEKLYLDNCK